MSKTDTSINNLTYDILICVICYRPFTKHPINPDVAKMCPPCANGYGNGEFISKDKDKDKDNPVYKF